MSTTDTAAAPSNFIRHIIDADRATNKHDGRVITRFPPEPNGYLHIGHAKSICLNFGIARDYHGQCSLRFDDTNPLKEDLEYIEAIKEDVHWLGFDWGERLYHASDYFDRLYDWAVELVRKELAYVDSLTGEQIREFRGTLTEPGQNSPFRERSVAENLDMLERMRAGEFEDGSHVLRAKIDMASPNINLRDPVIYRIRRASHPMTGDKWSIYPMYDFTHCLSDAMEGVTHSLCTLEFEDHRPLYDWFLDNVSAPAHPQQIEFSRLNLDYTVMSKRMLNKLVNEGHVAGWDDPRMPTLVGLRRRGFTSAAIRDFCNRIGVTKQENRIELSLLENCVREDLDRSAPRAMAVINPLKVVITNYPEDSHEIRVAPAHPKDDTMGSRQIPFDREIWIEAEDFMEDPPKKFFRLGPGREVRLRYAYIIRCDEVIKDDNGNVVELRCSYDPESATGGANAERKVKGVLHWVSVRHGQPAEIRLYDRLFQSPSPNGDNLQEHLNPTSVDIRQGWVEPGIAALTAEARVQFERLGFFCADRWIHRPGERLVFNRTVTLRDTWAKVNK